MIGAYPNFSKLEIKHQPAINNFTSQFEPFSDFNFTSLFCWNDDNMTEVSWLNGNLIIRLPDYLDGHPVYSILGSTDLDQALDLLLGQVKKVDLVPQVVIDALHDQSRFKIEEDPDNFDYVYDVAHLSELAGGHFKKKRNKHNVFVRDHANYELVVRTISSLDADHIALLKKTDRQWAAQTPRDEGDVVADRKALETLLDNFAKLHTFITEILVDGDIKAFSINEKLAAGYAICHFEKALKVHHQNIYTFVAAEVARELKRAGCRLVNWEQDLGLPGLRKAKQSYHPVKMLKKYTVSRLPNHAVDPGQHHKQ